MAQQNQQQSQQNGMQGLTSLLSGLFGNSGAGYKDAWNAYQPWMQKAASGFAPYQQAGQNGLNGLQSMLGGMSNPSEFINHLMGGYQQSPWAAYSTLQGQRAGNNAASASGMLGSTPFLQQSQQNAQNISSQDMQNWLGNVLNTNQQALQGYGGLADMGLMGAKGLGDIYGNMGQAAGGAAFGEQQGHQNDLGNIFGGLGKLFG